MADWNDLDRELDAWAAAGRAATFWWRDDDTGEADDAFDRLMALTGETGVPLALAVIPARAEAALGRPLSRGRQVSVLQHGYAHRNHAPPAAKKTELGPHRPPQLILAELAAGRQSLESQFGKDFLPVLVPPWNRIGPGLVPVLPKIGYAGLSTYGARHRAEPSPELVQVNTHIDIVDWHGHRGFAGEATALALVTNHLAARRAGAADRDEPTGLLTHHLAHDEACWAFTRAFLERTKAHSAARWLDAGEVFQPAASRRQARASA